MNRFAYKKDFQRKSTGKLTKRTLHQKLVITGLLGLGPFFFQSHALATEYGSMTGGNITLNDGDKIIADTLDSSLLYGINNPTNNKNSVIDLASGASVIANATGNNSSRAIIMNGANSSLKANELTISATGRNAVGLAINNKSKVDLGNGGSIHIAGTGSGQAITVSGASGLKANGIDINTSYTATNSMFPAVHINDHGSSVDLGTGSSITTNSAGALGVSILGSNGSAVNGPAKFTASNLSISTSGNLASGIEANNNSIVDLGSGTTILTQGTNANGITMYSTTVNADALTVATTGGNSLALEARLKAKVNIGAGSHISSEKAGALVASGSDVLVNFLGTESNRNSIFSSGSYGASAQTGNSVINLSNTDITIDRIGAIGVGLWTMSGGKIKGDNLTVNGSMDSRGVYAMNDSQIDLTGNTVIKMADPAGMAIATQDNAGYAPSRINASGLMDIQGSILSRGGMINITMTPGSTLTGATSSDGVNGGELNMAMTHSNWTMIADSNVTKLALNNSTVDYAEDKTGSVLTVGDLSGNGTFIMRANIVGDGDGVNNSGDKLIVTGTSAGDHSLKILNRGSLATTGNEILTVVETADGHANFGLDSSVRKVELGGYLYGVRKNGNNWELSSSGAVPPPEPPVDPIDPVEPNIPAEPIVPAEPVDPVSPGTPEPNEEGGSGPITSAADAGANFLNIGYLMNYAETQTLLQRMGDLRRNNEHGDMWLRAFSGKFDSFSSGKMSGFDMSYNGIQFGADKRISEEIPLILGAFVGMASGNPNYSSGDGSVKSNHMGVYATYMAPGGFYTDAVAKYSRLNNKFSVLDSQDNTVRGSGNSDGVSFSLEVGRKFNLNQPGNGFYIEPQAQLSYSHQNSARMTSNNGLNIDLDGYDSKLARTSAIVGYELNSGTTVVNAYFKTGYVHEFDGDADYHLNGSNEQHTFKGGWWNNGIGVSAQINKQHTLYVDVDSATGNKFDQRQINGGYRFSF